MVYWMLVITVFLYHWQNGFIGCWLLQCFYIIGTFLLSAWCLRIRARHVGESESDGMCFGCSIGYVQCNPKLQGGRAYRWALVSWLSGGC